MAKFKKGDWVVFIDQDNNTLLFGTVGVVLENNSRCPFCSWEGVPEHMRIYAVDEESLVWAKLAENSLWKVLND